MKRLLATLCIAVGFTLPHFITFKYVCETSERWPHFYGFPFVQSTNGTWVFSMSGNLFISGFIGNVLFWSVLIYGLVYFLDSITSKIFKTVGKVIIVILCALSLFIIYFEVFVFDWNVHWSHNDFKMSYYEQDLDCERTFEFFD
ncbi:hypothetical protein [Lacinutrix salivirga]